MVLQVGGEFYLDVREKKLFGFEKYKFGILIASLVRGVKRGDDFPPVPVIKDLHNNEVFYLSPLTKSEPHLPNRPVLDGGHKRSLAHFIAGEPLKCFLVEGRISPFVNLPIGSTILEYEEERDFERLKSQQIMFEDYRNVSRREYIAFRERFPHKRSVESRL